MPRETIGARERERRNRLIAKWQRSGESAAAFAGRHGVSQWSLYSWAKAKAEWNRRRPPRRSARRSTTTGTAVEILLCGGDVVRVVGEVGVERSRAVMAAVRQTC